MASLSRMKLLRYFIVSINITFSIVSADTWEEEEWLGVPHLDVNPNVKQWTSYEVDFTTTPTGAAAETLQSWLPSNTNDLGVVPMTTTIDGTAQEATSTEYVQFASATVTSDGSTAVETHMLVAPAILPHINDAAGVACGGGGLKKRQLCDLSKVAADDIAAALYTTLLKNDIILPLLATLGIIQIVRGGALLLPARERYTITGTLPATTTSGVERTVTAWMDLPYTNEADLSSELRAATLGPPPPPMSTTTTSTSLACAGTGAATINNESALTDVGMFCNEQDHLVKINPSSGTSENFAGLGGNTTLSVNWASGCTSDGANYTLNQDDCNTYLNRTISDCDVNSNDKNGGNVTVDCVVYAMEPQPSLAPTPFDNPPPLPDPTSQQLSCASATPNAIMFNQIDAVSEINKFCDYLHNHKVIMSPNPPYFGNNPPHSPGVTDECCETSSPNNAISVGVRPSCK